MSLLGRLLTPLNIFGTDPTLPNILYLIFALIIAIIIVAVTISLYCEPWAARLLALSIIYYMWFNYNNHYELHKDKS